MLAPLCSCAPRRSERAWRRSVSGCRARAAMVMWHMGCDRSAQPDTKVDTLPLYVHTYSPVHMSDLTACNLVRDPSGTRWGGEACAGARGVHKATEGPTGSGRQTKVYLALYTGTRVLVRPPSQHRTRRDQVLGADHRAVAGVHTTRGGGVAGKGSEGHSPA